MENLEYTSINGFNVQIAASADDVISTLNSSSKNTTTKSRNTTSKNNTSKNTTTSGHSTVTDEVSSKSTSKSDDYDYTVGTTISSFMFLSSVVLAIIVWIVCVISLVLNIVRKNVGKAIFSGVGLVLPFISMIIASVGRNIDLYNESFGIGSILSIIAVLLEIVTIVLSFIFCFSKRKNK